MNHPQFKGTIRSFTPDGYERLLEIIHQDSKKAYWVSIFEPEHYIDPSITSDSSQIGQEIILRVALKLVIQVQTLDSNSTLGIVQPISNSPHSVMVGEITQILDSDLLVCLAGEDFPSILVELEHPKSLAIGQVIRAVGELSNHA